MIRDALRRAGACLLLVLAGFVAAAPALSKPIGTMFRETWTTREALPRVGRESLRKQPNPL